MSKETVFLADSSYAIRKIAERNFAEENNYSLVTFKSGQSLKEQILEQKPFVILVELKLPEWNGYEVCKFVNSEPSLTHTHVFLLRAAFDPVEEDKLHGIQYVDIVTKPFDHALLIESIEKLGKGAAAEATSAPDQVEMPDDFPEIDDFDAPAPAQDISFSDIKNVIDEDLPSAAAAQAAPTFQIPVMHRPREAFGDEVQPSEEVTQGSLPGGSDSLSPDSQTDEIDNPFADDDSLQDHIHEQEREMGIGSITQEALAIEAAISKAGMEADNDEGIDSLPGIADKGDTSEVVAHSALDTDVSDDEFKNFSFDESDSLSFPSSADEPAAAAETEFPAPEEEEAGNFDLDEAPAPDSFDRPKTPSFLDIAASQEDQEEPEEFTPDSIQTETPDDDVPHWAAPPQPSFNDFVIEPKEEEEVEQEDVLEVPEPLDKEIGQFDDFPGVEDPSDEANYSQTVIPEPDNTRTSESQAIPDFSAQEYTPAPQVFTPPVQPPPIPTASPAPAAPAAPVTLESMTSTDREIILQRIEQNISQTLKDILWDIIPPIAERIIREEIESIKKEIAQNID